MRLTDSKTEDLITQIEKGTITTVPGVLTASCHCGIRKAKEDFSIVFLPGRTDCSGVFTTNKFAAAPVLVSKKQLAVNHNINAIIVNSGIANACTGRQGIENAEKTVKMAAEYLGIPEQNVLVASTGRIGRQLPLDKIEYGLKYCSSHLSNENGHNTAKAILTIDKHPKEVALKFSYKGNDVYIGGIAKGSVMVEPNMATTLSFTATNAKISHKLLDKLLFECADQTFNCISTDGCQSTNDMALLIANGESGIEITEENTELYNIFKLGLFMVFEDLCAKVVEDGEGATKVIAIKVSGARDKNEARSIGKKVANSILFKAAMYGEDINWGRIAAAIGSFENSIDTSKIDIACGDIFVMKEGMSVEFDEENANRLLKDRHIGFDINLNSGQGFARILTNDITYEYIKLNAFYKKQQ
ncbi:MAG: Arginine biosynthesis bifunctional protein ArgJ [Actinobacteria bacterium ADurb.Bin346]|nr:MAG: Arginine biosynthesis bifunctional protein ArgJ [Actinobacteria bacterium ADurb.Bin346]